MSKKDRNGGDAVVHLRKNLVHLHAEPWGEEFPSPPEFRPVPYLGFDTFWSDAQVLVNHLWMKCDTDDGRVFVYADSVPNMDSTTVQSIMAELCAVGLVSAVLYDGGFMVDLPEPGSLFAPSVIGETPFHELQAIHDMSHSKLRGGVYVMRTGWGRTAAIKVGISGNIESRFKQAATFSPWGLTLLYRIPGDGKDERALHQLLRPYRIRSEWFRWDMKVKGLLESFIQTRVRS